MHRCLVVTNDFPPRQGGIETFVYELVARFPPERVVVYTSDEPGGDQFDAALPFPVIRDRSRMLLPVPRVARRACELARSYGCDRVWFGAAAPLGLMADRLRRAGVVRSVATTHGHEVWWAGVPGARRLLRRIAERVDALTYLGTYTRSRLSPVVGDVVRMARLVPGVDPSAFRPAVPAQPGGPPVILTVGRLVARKGQDTLIRALPAVRRAVPGTTLLVVGTGPDRRRLQRLVARLGLVGAVVFAGGRPHQELPPLYAGADVFAMPCRTRRLGLEPEGLGIVFLEAAASGLPVVAGDSGGAGDAVRHGETGYLVDGGSVEQVAGRLVELLADRETARAMGEKGRAWVAAEWTWDASYRRLTRLLNEEGG
jgi:phosphatidyl-myo-inositol dimannoside synthase